MILGRQFPAHVVAVEKSVIGPKYHAFRLLTERDAWVDKDPKHREIMFAHDPRVLKAWDAFTIILHPDSRVRRRSWKSL